VTTLREGGMHIQDIKILCFSLNCIYKLKISTQINVFFNNLHCMFGENRYIDFTYKAHFDFNGYVNKQSTPISSPEKSHALMEAPLHPHSMVCCFSHRIAG
jgi:hypothetical protein